MENFPNICSCLFAFNIILRLARNCHIKQIFENFSFSLYPLTITRSRRLPPPFSLIGLSRFPPLRSPTPFLPFSPTRNPAFHSPHASAAPLPLSLSPHAYHTLQCRRLSPPIFTNHPDFRRPARPFFFRFSAANDRPLSAHTRFNLKKVFVIYVQKRKFVVE